MNEKQYIETTAFKTFYYSDKAMTELHREGAPAVEYATGTKAWYTNGELHRVDGPAVEWSGGGKEWYLNNERLTEEEFNLRMSPILELTLDEIAKKFGVSVDKLKIKA